MRASELTVTVANDDIVLVYGLSLAPTHYAATSPLDAVADEDYEDRMLHRKASQVNFDPKVTDRKSNLTRDPTPFPKELHSKAMQWRAAREKGGSGPHHGREGAGSPGVGMDEVALRRPLNRRLPNRYSLLKALSDPLIEVIIYCTKNLITYVAPFGMLMLECVHVHVHVHVPSRGSRP